MTLQAAMTARQRARPPRRSRNLEWRTARADARAFSSSLDPLRLFHGVVACADGAVVALASGCASVCRYGLVVPSSHVVIATILAVLAMLNLARNGNVAQPPLAEPLATQLLRVLRSWTLTMVGLLVAAYLFRVSDSYSRTWAIAWFLFGLTGLSLVQAASAQWLRSLRERGRFARMVAIVDLDDTGHALARQLRDDPAADMRLLGVFTTQAAGEPPAGRSTIEDLIRLSQLFRIDDVLVTISWPGHPAIKDVLRRLSTIPTTVRLCPVLPHTLPAPACEAELLLANPTIVVCRRPLPGWHVVLKRTEDLLLGSVMLLLLSPLMLLVALLVRLDSPGPALFRQERLGFNNNPITVYKFRSMTNRPHEAEVVQASRGDARVTRVGRFLRRSSLDELPQLLNVLRGEMSLVGPRPHATAHNVQYAALIDDYLGRHRVQPGITGWAQVNGLRGETDTLEKMQKRVEFDLAYIERWSVMFDIRIIVQTALGVLFHREAY